jgi:hypothetical protein
MKLANNLIIFGALQVCEKNIAFCAIRDFVYQILLISSLILCAITDLVILGWYVNLFDLTHQIGVWWLIQMLNQRRSFGD